MSSTYTSSVSPPVVRFWVFVEVSVVLLQSVPVGLCVARRWYHCLRPVLLDAVELLACWTASGACNLLPAFHVWSRRGAMKPYLAFTCFLQPCPLEASIHRHKTLSCVGSSRTQLRVLRTRFVGPRVSVTPQACLSAYKCATARINQFSYNFSFAYSAARVRSSC